MRTVKTQHVPPTVAPGKTPRDKVAARYPDMHLVLVEEEHKNNPWGYLSPMETYKAQGFVDLEGGQEATGYERMKLVGMPKADWQAMKKEEHESLRLNDVRGPDKLEVKRGGPLSFGDLAKLDATASKSEPLAGFMNLPE